MESSFWHKCWERNTLGFHQSDVHPLLSQYFNKLCLPSDKHIFVPLCGKTLDMAYLAKYMQVTGNELSEIACRDFFLDNSIEYQKQTLGDFTHFSCPQLLLLQGDFFKLNADNIESIDWIYDRAALIALPIAMQREYVNHLKSVDVNSLFSGFNIECIAKNEIKGKQFAQRTLEVDYLIEKLYIISTNNSEYS